MLNFRYKKIVSFIRLLQKTTNIEKSIMKVPQATIAVETFLKDWAICRFGMNHAYIIGKNISFFKKKIDNSVNYSISQNINKAINNIYTDIKKNKKIKNTILLSPAAASFDQFKNFESRGLYFKKLVKKKFKIK